MEHSPFEILENCPLCGSPENSTFLETKDFLLSDKSFSISICHHCGHKYTNPRPTIADANSYYQSTKYIPHTSASYNLIAKTYRIIRKSNLKKKERILRRFAPKAPHVLDIGCGTGEFPAFLKKKKYRVACIEKDEGARNYAKQQYNLTVYDEADLYSFQNEGFDVVTMWHVLEHIYHTEAILKKIHELLTKNGIAMIAVPNAGSFDAEIYGEYWAAYDLPRHVHHFSPQTILPFLQKCGFTIVEVLPLLFDSFYICLLSEQYKTGKNNYLRGLINGLRSNIRGCFSVNQYSSLLYIIKKG